MQTGLPLITPIVGLLGLALAFLIFRNILKKPGGDGNVADIADQIHRGAMVFMRREAKLLVIFSIIVGGALAFYQPFTSVAFFLGALASGLAGFIGMYTATKSNVRTTLAAHYEGPASALTTAFLGGSIMGLTVASMGLLGVGDSSSSSARRPRTPTSSRASPWARPWWPSSTGSGAGSSPRPPMWARTW